MRIPTPTGPRIKYVPRPTGLPQGTPWPPPTVRKGGQASNAHERVRKGVEGVLPSGGVRTGGGQGSDGGNRGRTESGGFQPSSQIRALPGRLRLGIGGR